MIEFFNEEISNLHQASQDNQMILESYLIYFTSHFISFLLDFRATSSLSEITSTSDFLNHQLAALRTKNLQVDSELKVFF